MKMISMALLATSIYSLAQDASGFWQGAIQVQNQNLEIIVDLDHGDAGWTGTIDIPLQGLKGFALSEIKAQGESIEFKMNGIPGTPHFAGKVAASGNRIEGDFHQNGATFKFELNRGDKAAYLAKTKKEPIKPIKGSGVPGSWAGDLKAGASELRLIFEIAAQGDQLTAILNSVDQGIKLKADRVNFKGNGLTIEVSQIQGEFEAKMREDGSAFEGTWYQGGMELPLTVYRVK